MVYDIHLEEAYADLAAAEGEDVAEWVRYEYGEEFRELLGLERCSAAESASVEQAHFSTLYPDDVAYGEDGIEELQELYEDTVGRWTKEREIEPQHERLMEKIESATQTIREEDWEPADMLEFRAAMVYDDDGGDVSMVYDEDGDGLDPSVEEALEQVLTEREEERNTARRALASFMEPYETLREFRDAYRELTDETMEDVRNAVEEADGETDLSFASLLSDGFEDSELPREVRDSLHDAGYSRSDTREIANALTV